MTIKVAALEERYLDGEAEASIRPDAEILYNQLSEMAKLVPGLEPFQPPGPGSDFFNDSSADSIENYLKEVVRIAQNMNGHAFREKNRINKAMIDEMTAKVYQELKHDYYNTSLADMVLNNGLGNDIFVEVDGRLIRKYQPGYMEPTSRAGKAHLYAPVKILGRFEYETMWFNIVVIWLYTFLFYVTLRTDLLRKAINISETRRLRRLSRRQTT
jgi:hypothetical protein